MPFSRKNEYYKLECHDYTLYRVLKLTATQMKHDIYSWPNLGVSRGQNGGQKGQNVPFSRKNEYYELEFCNYTLDRVGKLTAT